MRVVRDAVAVIALICIAVTLAIPAGGMLSDWLLHAGIRPSLEGLP